MIRRTLLAAVGSATAASSLAGCLGDRPESVTPNAGGDRDGGDDTAENENGNGTASGTGTETTDGETDDETTHDTDEQCDRDVVWYHELPANVAAEVDAALEDGAYETDGELYYAQAIDVEAVSLEETTTKSSSEELAFRNATDDELTASVTVRPADGDEVLLEEEGIELDPETTAYDDPRFPVTGEYGTYDVSLETDDGRTESLAWTIGYGSFNGVLVLEEEDAFVVSEAEMDLPPCPWTRR